MAKRRAPKAPARGSAGRARKAPRGAPRAPKGLLPRLAAAVGGPVLLYARSLEGDARLVGKARLARGEPTPPDSVPSGGERAALKGWRRTALRSEGRIVGLLAYRPERRDRAAPARPLLLEAALTAATWSLANAGPRPRHGNAAEAQEVGALVAAGRALAGTLRVDDLMRVLVEEVHTLTGVPNVYVALHDPATAMLRFPLFLEQGKYVERPARPLGAGLTERVIRAGAPLLITGDFEGTVKRLGVTHLGHAARSWLGVPLKAGRRTLGVLGIFDAAREGAVNARHVPILTALAAQLAVSLDNASLYQQVLDSEARTRAVVEAAGSARMGLGILADDREMGLRFEFLNDVLASLLGLTPEEARARPVTSFLPDRDLARVAEIRKAWLKGAAAPLVLETVLLQPSGRVVPVEVSLGPATVGGRVQAVVFVRDISERKSHEEELARQTRLYETLLKAQSDVGEGFLITQGGRAIYANEAYCSLTGYTLDELKALPSLLALARPEEVKGLAERHARRLAGEPVPDRYESVLIAKDGREVPLEVAVKMLPGSEPVEMITVVRDITERKRAEEALRASEARLRDIVEHSTNVFYAHTRDHVLTYASPRTRQFFDCEPEEALRRWTDFLSDNPANAIGLERTEAALKTGDRQPAYELELVGKLGRKIWVEVNEAPIVRDGEVVGIVGSLTDVTERKKAQAFYRAVVETASRAKEGVAILQDRAGEGRYIYANEEFARITGYSPEELEGMPFSQVLAEESLAFVRDIYERRGRGEDVPATYEATLRRKDGALVPVEISAGVTTIPGALTHVAFVKDIGERKAAEAKLLQLKNLLQEIIENVPAGVLYLDADGIIIFENRYLLRLMGAPEGEVPRGWFTSILDLPTVSEHPEFVTNVRKLLRGETFHEFELTYRSLYGRDVSISVSGVPIYEALAGDGGGTLKGGVLLVRDTTEERSLARQLTEYARELEAKVAERTQALSAANVALERAKLNLETVFDATIDGFLFVDKDRGFVSANKRFCELFGYTLDELIRGDPQEVRAKGRAAMKDPAYFDATLSLYEPDKRHLVYDGEVELVTPVPRRVHEHSEPIFDASGEYLGRVWTYRDVTEQRLLQEALAERSQLLTTILENVTDGVFALSPRGEYLFCNRRHAELMGFGDESVVHRPLFHGFAPERAAQYRNALAAALDGHHAVTLEFPFVNRGARDLHLQWNVHPLVVDGRVVQVVGTVTDLTDRKRLEEALIEYTRTLEEEVDKRTQDLLQAAKMAALGQLVAGVAHEINNPLAFVKSNTETLLEVSREIVANPDVAAVMRGDATRIAPATAWLAGSGNLAFTLEKQPQLLEMNMKGLARIGDIVHRLKAIASPQPTKKAPTDFNAFLRDTALIFQSQFRDRVDLVEEYAEGLPQVACDAGQVSQVAMNLLTNAAQAMTGKGRVALRTRREGKYAVFEVEDNGIGMTPEVRARIFDPFYTTKDKGNTGLGLSISFQIVKEHDGDISVRSTPGEGTVFTVRIPIQPKA